MPLRCPTCGASQEPSPTCRRCRSDLMLLVECSEQEQVLREQCLRALAAGCSVEAHQAACQLVDLAPGPDSYRLLAVSLLLQGAFEPALAVCAAALELERP